MSTEIDECKIRKWILLFNSAVLAVINLLYEYIRLPIPTCYMIRFSIRGLYSLTFTLALVEGDTLWTHYETPQMPMRIYYPKETIINYLWFIDVSYAFFAGASQSFKLFTRVWLPSWMLNIGSILTKWSSALPCMTNFPLLSVTVSSITSSGVSLSKACAFNICCHY